MSKYRAIKTEVDGIKFDSKKEANRYDQLRLLEKARQISQLELQPSFRIEINGVKVCDYKGDFRYVEDGKTIVEDVKSEITRKLPVYRLKKKLMYAVYGIEILET